MRCVLIPIIYVRTAIKIANRITRKIMVICNGWADRKKNCSYEHFNKFHIFSFLVVDFE